MAELAAAQKSAKYTNLDTHYTFQLVAIEMLGPINDSARDFLSNLGRKISLQSGDDREVSFLIQRSNAVLLHNSFAQEDDLRPFQLLCMV